MTASRPLWSRGRKHSWLDESTAEEGPEGLYEYCEQLAGAEAEALVAQLQAASEVPVAAHTDGPQVMDVVRRVLVRAGYDAAVMPDTP